jgi:hypothetical protein
MRETCTPSSVGRGHAARINDYNNLLSDPQNQEPNSSVPMCRLKLLALPLLLIVDETNILRFEYKCFNYAVITKAKILSLKREICCAEIRILLMNEVKVFAVGVDISEFLPRLNYIF